MKFLKHCVALFLLFGLSHFAAFCQEPSNKNANDSTDIEQSDEPEKANNFTIAVTGGNSLVQKGKRPATPEAYANPLFSYSHSSGISASVGAMYMPSDKKRPLDDVTFNAGYSKTLFEHWTLGAGYAWGHYFSSKQVASTEANSVSLSTGWSNNIITPSVSAGYAFGQTSDLTYTGSLSHDFSFDGLFTDEDNLTFPVSLTAMAGTTNFYSEYIKQNPNKIQSKKKKKAVTAQDINTGFALTAVTFNLGVSYTISKFTLSTDMSYILMTNDSSDLNLSNAPTFTFTLAYAF